MLHIFQLLKKAYLLRLIAIYPDCGLVEYSPGQLKRQTKLYSHRYACNKYLLFLVLSLFNVVIIG